MRQKLQCTIIIEQIFHKSHSSDRTIRDTNVHHLAALKISHTKAWGNSHHNHYLTNRQLSTQHGNSFAK